MADTVLLVDDNIDLLESTQTMLEHKKIQVFTAKNGEEAVQKYKSNKPCLVFMDLMMPKKNGYEAFDEIIQDDPAAKIIFVTGYVEDHEKLMNAKKGGLLSFIHKPMSLHDYEKLISKYD